MSPERRLSKSTRRRVRELKAHIRHEAGVTRPQIDSYLWEETEESLRLSLSGYSEKYAPHTTILKEYYLIRVVTIGKPEKLNEELATFRQRHDPEILKGLKPAIGAIIDIVNKRVI